MGTALLVFGTRPEAVKLAPVAEALKGTSLEPRLCSTGQHREMLDQVLEVFGLTPHHDLRLMRPEQNLFTLTAEALLGLKGVMEQEKPDVVIVQGDTTSVLAGALAAFYLRIPVAHVEAGLRTGDRHAPFPEEMNRLLAGDLADYHFAPTATARDALLREGKDPDRVWVTGNTSIDALQWAVKRLAPLPRPPGVDPATADKLAQACEGGRMVLVTAHRRESFGAPMESIAHAVAAVARDHPDVHIVFPVHLNPNVQRPVRRILGEQPRVTLVDPLPYAAFTWTMARAVLILTDSGGVQEEAPSLAKPVLVLREKTERPEGVAAGAARLVGTDTQTIREAANELLTDKAAYARMASARNPYGDGTAARHIARILGEQLVTRT